MSTWSTGTAKTRPTDVPVERFLAEVDHPQRRAEAEALLAVFARATGEEPVLWGPSIIGFGRYRYRYASGRAGHAPAVGFSPRKANLVLYVLTDHPAQDELLARLGRHRTSVACLYLTRLADVDLEVLEELITNAHRHTLDHLDRGPAEP